MRRTDALKIVLRDIGMIYHDGSPVEIEFADVNAADPDGRTIYIAPNVREAIGRNLSGADELRVLADTVSHEVEHFRESNLTDKADFMAENPDVPNVAGMIINVLEDVYIDRTRLDRFRGLRATHAFVIDAIMRNHQRRPSMTNLPVEAQMVEGFLQLAFTGRVKKYADAEQSAKDFLATARPLIDRARNEPDQQTRKDIAETVLDLYRHYAPDPPEGEGRAKENGDGRGGESGDAGNTSPDPNGSPNGGDTDGDVDGDPDDDGTPTGDAVPSDESTEGQTSHPDLSEFDVTGEDVANASNALDTDDYSSGDWWDVPDSVDYETDEEFEKQYEKFEELRDKLSGDVGKQKRARDKRIKEREEVGKADHTSTERWAKFNRNGGLKDDIVEAFRVFKTRDVPTPQRVGPRLNIRNVVRHASGDRSVTNLYERPDPIEMGDRVIGVALDASGSMYWDEACDAMHAIAVAVEEIGDDLVACAFTDKGTPKGKSSWLVKASDETYDPRVLDNMEFGATPTAGGIRDCRALLEDSYRAEQVMIVVTDGKPTEPLNQNSPGDATKDAARQVEAARRDGVKVIGLGVGNVRERKMRQMFGDDYVLADFDDLAEALVEIYRRQMHVTRDR